MLQVLLRSRGLLERPPVLAFLLLVAVGGALLVAVPLFGVPGYELSQALTLALGVGGGGVAVAAARQERRILAGQGPRGARSFGATGSVGAAIGAASVLNLAAVLPPLLAAGAWSALGTRCDPFAQAGFVALLPLPSALLASAVGTLTGFIAPRARGALLLYAGVLLGTVAVTAWPIYFGPQVFAFNHLLGYFPGPLYDEALWVRPPLYWFRLHSLLWAGAAASLAVLCLDLRDGRARPPRLRPAPAGFLALCLLGAGVLAVKGPALGLRVTHTHLAAQLGAVHDTPHFRIHYFRGKPRAEMLRLERDLEFRWTQLSEFLGGAPEEPILVYLYRSPEQKQKLVGAGGTQFAKPWQLAIHINDAGFPHPVLKHELLHVMAAPYGSGPFRTTARFGVWAQMAVIEGLAVAGDNRADDLTLHQWAAAMRRNQLGPDVRLLFSADGFYKVAASRAYTTAGSFLRFLAETYGTERLRQLYYDGNFQRAYGKPLDELAAQWERWVDEVPLEVHAQVQAEQRFRKPSLFARSCAREVATLEKEGWDFMRSDPEQALGRFRRCAELQPEEPSFTLAQARALWATQQQAEAEQVLAGLEATVSHLPSVDAEVGVARADLAWDEGRLQDARAHLQRVLSLQPAPGVQRGAHVRLAALEEPARAPAVRTWFREGAADGVKMVLLREALVHAPLDPYLNYLLGRRLLEHDAPLLAQAHLTASLEGELPASLRREALRLQIVAAYLAGDCALVRHAVGGLPDMGEAFTQSAREWQERCAFETVSFNGPLVPVPPFR
jgi:tetratricopeptide (TPR) repeat protein